MPDEFIELNHIIAATYSSSSGRVRDTLCQVTGLLTIVDTHLSVINALIDSGQLGAPTDGELAGLSG
jgi:hypothetical protein